MFATEVIDCWHADGRTTSKDVIAAFIGLWDDRDESGPTSYRLHPCRSSWTGQESDRLSGCPSWRGPQDNGLLGRSLYTLAGMGCPVHLRRVCHKRSVAGYDNGYDMAQNKGWKQMDEDGFGLVSGFSRMGTGMNHLYKWFLLWMPEAST